MTIYSATLNSFIDGDNIYLNVDIGGGQIVVKNIRLRGIWTENINKQYLKNFRGAKGITALLEIKKWIYENSTDLEVIDPIIDICGRWLVELKASGNSESLNDYMINKYYKNADWNNEKQEELKDDWFAGEQVTVPEGDELPIFHNWGKNVFIGLMHK